MLISMILAAVYAGRRDLRSQADSKSTVPAVSLIPTDQDKILLQEALRLKRILGDEVWPSLPYWTWDFVRLEKQLGTQQGDLRFYLSSLGNQG